MTTITTRIAAIQLKMLHLQFRMKKIFDDQKRLNESLPPNCPPREVIKRMNNAVYSAIDMIIVFEHMFKLANEIFNTQEIKNKFDMELTKIVGTVRSISHKWKPVRNKLGGHIDLAVAEEVCKKHGYAGVFISEDLEADLGVLNMLLIESAVNSVNNQSKIFDTPLDLKTNGIAVEIKRFVDTLNKDWHQVFSYFEPLMKYLYDVGKKEKMESTHPSEWKGILKD